MLIFHSFLYVYQRVESKPKDLPKGRNSIPTVNPALIFLRMKHPITAAIRLSGKFGKKRGESKRLIAVMNTLCPLDFTLRPKVLIPN